MAAILGFTYTLPSVVRAPFFWAHSPSGRLGEEKTLSHRFAFRAAISAFFTLAFFAVLSLELNTRDDVFVEGYGVLPVKLDQIRSRIVYDFA